jgi:hypothetical protein
MWLSHYRDIAEAVNAVTTVTLEICSSTDDPASLYSRQRQYEDEEACTGTADLNGDWQGSYVMAGEG